MIGVLDYGVGNLFSLKASLKAVGAEVMVSSDQKALKNCDRLILPGVGAFGDASARLQEGNFVPFLQNWAKEKPLLGICLGMQLLFEESEEFGLHKGLGLLPGSVRRMNASEEAGLKLPQMGWNRLEISKESPLLPKECQGEYMYFVHSFAAEDCDDCLLATTDYGLPVTAFVGKGRVFGAQFHPEKSGEAGLALLKRFANWNE
ncbi:MAG: imidazole glycerol phosphate synthase subunit HisH [Oscillospiraceae bacterium]|nr:imidazole glycerol phosphate synthase subunit HisH [Oscillospiraceae bacterium]